MKAAVLREVGPPESIQLQEVETPSPSKGQVRIRVHAASVNPIDTYVRGGLVSFDLPNPYFPGCDAAGIVDAVGDDVSEVQVGDRVWCTNQGLLGLQGTAAEQIVVDAVWVYKLPDEVPFENAAAMALTGVTAHLGLFREANLMAGETVLVVGGTGGVGSAVVQIAKRVGATVIATARGQEKAERLREMEVDTVIDLENESITDARRRVASEGVNVFWETRREPDFESAIEVLADRGRMILMAGRDAKPAFPVGPFYVKECSLHGFVMFKGSPEELRAAADDITDWLLEGSLKPVIGKTFPLDELSEAHRLQEAATIHGSEKLLGKIVISID